MNASAGTPEGDRVAIAYLVHNRRFYIVPYLLMCLAGLSSLFIAPSTSVSSQMGDVVQVVFSIVFIASAFMCFLGAATDWWILEYMGLIPLFGSFVTFGVAIIGYGFVTGWQVLPAGLSVLGFGLMFFARWKDIAFLYDHVTRDESETP